MASAPPPTLDPISREGVVTQTWLEWLDSITDEVDKSQRLVDSVALTAQGASITATNIAGASLAAGLYRVSYYARVTTAAVTSSSLTVTFGWTETVAVAFAGAAITGNTTASGQSGEVMVRVDANTNITYATTYASNGAGEMKYRLDVVLQRVPV